MVACPHCGSQIVAFTKKCPNCHLDIHISKNTDEPQKTSLTKKLSKTLQIGSASSKTIKAKLPDSSTNTQFIQCPFCHKNTNANQLFCEFCKSSLTTVGKQSKNYITVPKRCRICNTENDPMMKVCLHCGSSLNPVVFIVEDEAIVANDIRAMLKGLGYEVPPTAKSGELALEKIREFRPDIVLMDIHLAGKLDGIETAETIRSTSGTPVVFLTAYSDRDIIERAKISEPYGYILKPYDERELHSVIEMALYKHKIDHEMRKRGDILFVVSSAVEWLLRVSSKKADSEDHSRDIDPAAIQKFLTLISQPVGASIVSIFSIHLDNAGHPVFGMKYEWTAPGIPSRLASWNSRECSFTSLGLSHWFELLSNEKFILASKSSHAESEKAFLSLLGVRSGAVFPLIISDKLSGFIGFFTEKEKFWSDDELAALRISANLFSAAIG